VVQKPGDPGNTILAGGRGDCNMAPRAAKVEKVEEDSQRLATERITVALIPKAAEDLSRLQATTGLSKTDIVNRAISLYEFLQAQIDAENDFVVRDRKTGESQLVKFL
jgi:hypothetical protein